MWFRQVSDNDCIRFTVWIAVMITLASLFSISTGVLGQNTKMVFDETKDVERVKVTSGDNSERMIGAASDINRKHSSRVKLFDDIFNIPISVLQSVNNLIQGMLTSPGQSLMAASGFGRSMDLKEKRDSNS